METTTERRERARVILQKIADASNELRSLYNEKGAMVNGTAAKHMDEMFNGAFEMNSSDQIIVTEYHLQKFGGERGA